MRAHLPIALLVGVALACATRPTPAPPHPSPSPDAGPAVAAGACDRGVPPAAREAEADRFGRVSAPSNPRATCDVADSNIQAAEDAILGRAAATPKAAPPAPARGAPAWLDRIDARFHLTARERELLSKNGFVVPARLEFSSYAFALHEVYQSELPLYVSVDAVFNAVYAANDGLLAEVEERSLAPLLSRTIAALHCALPATGGAYPAETARDLDLYLTVARSLLDDRPVKSVFGADDEAARLAALAREAGPMREVTLFGRERNIDFSAYLPRGHYGGEGNTLTPYFRGATWLARLELNLVSRSSRSSAIRADPRETPREDLLALALADLVERAGVAADVETLDRAWALFAGPREDVSVSQLRALRTKAGIRSLTDPGADAALRAAIGEDFQRKTRTHYMPDGSTILPAITTLLGPRTVADAAATRPLVNPEVRDRHVIEATELAYALGHDRAKAYLGRELAAFPQLAAGLDRARAIVSAPPRGEDLYGAWLAAIRGLADRPRGAVPSFMGTTAYEDLRLSSTIAAFGQLRHNMVLVAAQSYDEGGCVVPDGYVEPAPAVYAGLLAYAARGGQVMRELDPADKTGAARYFAGLARVLKTLQTIAEGELAGRALSAEEQRFLSMVVEMLPGGTGGAPTYTGWYFDMFRQREAEGLKGAALIADFYTSGYVSKVAYAGVTGTRLGVFVVDTGGPARAFVGPVARAFQHTGPIEKRLADEDVPKLAEPLADPWAASYTAPAAPEPRLAIEASADLTKDDDAHVPPITVKLTSDRALGPVTVTLLDHHRRAYATLRLPVGPKATEFTFPRRAFAAGAAPAIEGLSVRVGDTTGDVLWGTGPGRYYASRSLGGMRTAQE